MVVIAALRAEDRAAWDALAAGYKAFYQTPTTAEEYEAAWQKLMQGSNVHGVVARLDDRVVGIAHYLFHSTVWAGDSCYLQDLFVEPGLRGQGIARRLIEAVAEIARSQGAVRYYWQTMHDNTTARTLYDKVARHKGFIRYDYPL